MEFKDDIAVELVLIHYEMLHVIPPRQFIKWLKAKKKVIIKFFAGLISINLFIHFFFLFLFFFFFQEETCQGIWILTQNFNRLVLWVTSEIVVCVRKEEVSITS